MLLRTQVFLHFRIAFVLLQLPRGLELLARLAVLVVGLHRVAKGSLLARELGQLRVVGGDIRPAHLGFDLPVATRDSVETVDQAAAPAVSSSPSRALLDAVMATSSMSSDGSRVVNFCVPRTGSRRMRTTGLRRCRAMKRMASKPAPAMIGIASTRLAVSQNQFGWKIAITLKTATLTTSTTMRNPVPQRGWRVLARRTEGTSSGQPDSKALIVLCSAP